MKEFPVIGDSPDQWEISTWWQNEKEGSSSNGKFPFSNQA